MYIYLQREKSLKAVNENRDISEVSKEFEENNQDIKGEFSN